MSDPAPIRVLVVEDDLSILTGLSMSLRFEGYEVLQAQDGRVGLKKALDEAPDLIVLDVMMPQMNGLEMLKELRARGKTTPEVVLSAKALEADRIAGLNLGADDYVSKPFSVQELVARIRAVLRRQLRDEAVVRFGDAEVDLRAKQATKAGAPVFSDASADLKTVTANTGGPGGGQGCPGGPGAGAGTGSGTESGSSTNPADANASTATS